MNLYCKRMCVCVCVKQQTQQAKDVRVCPTEGNAFKSPGERGDFFNNEIFDHVELDRFVTIIACLHTHTHTHTFTIQVHSGPHKHRYVCMCVRLESTGTDTERNKEH